MKHILLIGAGRSTKSLVDYISKHAGSSDWTMTICDQNTALAEKRASGNERFNAISLDITNEEERRSAIEKADLVISMLPAHMHVPVAEDCISMKKHMVTASYVSPQMEALNDKAVEAGVILMNEIGVDPGIDHLSAMKVLDEIRAKGGEMKIFESFTGGLVAPESDNNPWGYKFSWNPRNVVLAGAGGAVKFMQEGKYKYIPYHQLFRRTEFIDIPHYGRFEGYANRDSLRYRSVYGLEAIPTIYRGTLRRPGFCRAWDVFVKLGMTDDSYQLEGVKDMTHRSFLNTFLAYNPQDSVELKLMHYLQIPQDSDLMEKLDWLDLFEEIPIGLDKATPAQALQHILEKKWGMDPQDKDMIVMWHKFGFSLNGEDKMIESHMVRKGKDAENTAMAETVGLPVGIATRMILEEKITTPGVHLPITKEIYDPILAELAEEGITFEEREVEYKGY
ncbi:MAG: saccharopine dehydrogenase NADP-binding domain-containing protein [Flavobacteriia bacterium]|nr:saccharopine dehydrogenase NADP-binding domain-containing protein [Flavobacteriia bacterium]